MPLLEGRLVTRSGSGFLIPSPVCRTVVWPEAGRSCNPSGCWPVYSPSSFWFAVQRGKLCFRISGRALLGQILQVTFTALQAAFETHARLSANTSLPPRRVSVADVARRCNASFAAFAHEGEHARSCTERLIPHYWVFQQSDARYGNVTAQLGLAAAFLAQPVHKRCVWAGGYYHRVRRLLVRRMNRMPTLFEHLQRYMPMHKQALQYACIIDARGVGVSGRVPSLLLLGRPLLYIARPKLWSWYTDPSYEEPLRDWEHIVPVAANLSNLEERARWVFDEPEEAAALAHRAAAYARRHFARDMLLRQLSSQLFGVR